MEVPPLVRRLAGRDCGPRRVPRRTRCTECNAERQQMPDVYARDARAQAAPLTTAGAKAGLSVALRRSRLGGLFVPLAKKLQQHDEQVEEVEVKRQRAHDRRLFQDFA